MGREGAAAAVLAFINAFNDQDLEALAATLDPDVRIHAARGLRTGIDEALAWATRIETGELEQRIEVDGIRDQGDRTIALVRRQWWWRETEELAREDEMAWAFEVRDGKVSSWRPFEDRAAAFATGIGA